jgi:hypothetical protein
LMVQVTSSERCVELKIAKIAALSGCDNELQASITWPKAASRRISLRSADLARTVAPEGSRRGKDSSRGRLQGGQRSETEKGLPDPGSGVILKHANVKQHRAGGDATP